MKEIKLTQGKVALVDDSDFEWLNRSNWYFNNGYAVRNRWNSTTEKQETMRMHRFILKPSNGFEVDHINHNGLDNQRSNIRIVTSRQNQMNSLIRKDNNSGCKGVSWYKSQNKWRACIMLKGKQKFLGYYSTIKEAATAYNQASVTYYGNFGFRNDLSV